MTFGSICWLCSGAQPRAQRVRTKRWSFARGIGRRPIKAKFERPANYNDLGQIIGGAESVRRQSVSVSVALADLIGSIFFDTVPPGDAKSHKSAEAAARNPWQDVLADLRGRRDKIDTKPPSRFYFSQRKLFTVVRSPEVAQI